jgi:hypothetical protein
VKQQPFMKRSTSVTASGEDSALLGRSKQDVRLELDVDLIGKWYGHACMMDMNVSMMPSAAGHVLMGNVMVEKIFYSPKTL